MLLFLLFLYYYFFIFLSFIQPSNRIFSHYSLLTSAADEPYINLTFFCAHHIGGSGACVSDRFIFLPLMSARLPGVLCCIFSSFLLEELFAIPGEACNQILKMLSNPLRLTTRARDVSPASL